MKKTLIGIVPALLLCLAVGCDSGTPCDEAASVAEAAIDDACAGRDCQFCECWLNDQVVNSTGDGCEDPEPTDPAACEGATLDQANSCLDDRDACGTAAASIVDLACPAP